MRKAKVSQRSQGLKQGSSKPIAHRKQTNNASLNLLGLDAVYKGIHEWRKEKLDIAHGNVDHMWYMHPKPVDESQANHSDVRDQDTADMGDTCVESPSSLLSTGNAHHCLKDQMR